MTMVEPRPVVAPSTSGSPLLSVEDLRVEFSTNAGTVRALDGVTLHVDRGETLAVLGESGSGKSVTAQAIMALLPKTSGRIAGGRIVYDGVDLASQPIDVVRKRCGTEIAMVSQDPLSSLNPVFRVGVQVAEPFRRRRGMGRRRRPAPGPRAARAGRHPRRRAPHRRLSPSVLRRATPADHDRHRPGPRAATC